MPAWNDNLLSQFGTGFDPFVGTVKQTNRLKAYCRVWVAGVEVTKKLDPHLISVRIVDGTPSRICDLEIDDRDGTLPLPPLESLIRVNLGWVSESTFVDWVGRVQDLEYGVERGSGGGRRMWVHAISANYKGSQVDSPMDDNTGEGAPPGETVGKRMPLAGFLDKITSNAGATARIHPLFKQVMRDYWGQSAESLIHYGTKIMEQLGGTFQIVDDNVAEFSLPGQKPDGSQRTMVVARWGDNLIGCRVRPLLSRAVWGQTNQHYYENRAAHWMQVIQGLGLPNPWGQSKAAFTLPQPAQSTRRTSNSRYIRVSPQERSRTRRTFRSYQPICMRPQKPQAVFLSAA